MRTQVKRAFTLIEILIVVVILGILAAIVIPQFTDASQQAQDSSIRSQLQTVRSQIELFMIQNPTVGYPDFGTNGWEEMLDPNDNPAGRRYLQAEPRNALRDNGTDILTGTAAVGDDSGAADLTAAGANPDGVGWYWNTTNNIMYAIDANGTILDW